MTEFTIFLPVFVFLFAAILHLWAIEDLAVRGKANGYTRALAHHTAIQTSLNPVTADVVPALAMVEAGAYHAKTSSGADLVADGLFDGAIGQGHLGESYVRVLLAGTPDETADSMMRNTPVVYEPPPARLYARVAPGGAAVGRPLTPDRMIVRQFGTEPWPGGPATFTNHLFSDHVDPAQLFGGSSSPGWTSGWIDRAMSAGGARPAIAAGLRYGVTTEGLHDETTEMFARDFTVQTATHFAAPPRPASHWVTTAVVRSFLGGDEAYDDFILTFDNDPETSADSPDAEAFKECQESMGELTKENIGSVADGESACGDAEYTGGNPLEVFENIMENAESILGDNFPRQTSTGYYGDNPAPLDL